MSKRLNMSNDEAVEWLLSLKNLDICGENRKTAIDKAVTALKAQPTRVDETYLSIKDAISELKAMREHIVGYMSIVGTTAYDMGIEALEAQTCIEDYPTCTECEHYDSEKHYCPRFCQVIKDALHLKGHNENNDYADCDQFVCSECGIELQDWHRVERDIDDGDITYHEYTFRYCPNCGTLIEADEKLLNSDWGKMEVQE